MARNTSSPLRMSWACPSVTVNRNSKGKKNVLFVIFFFWMGLAVESSKHRRRGAPKVSFKLLYGFARSCYERLHARDLSESEHLVQQVFHLIAGRSVARGSLSRDVKASSFNSSSLRNHS